MEQTQTLSSEIDVRRNKIEQLIEAGEIPYKEKFERTHTIEEARKLPVGSKVRLCGRIIFRRIMGKFKRNTIYAFFIYRHYVEYSSECWN